MQHDLDSLNASLTGKPRDVAAVFPDTIEMARPLHSLQAQSSASLPNPIGPTASEGKRPTPSDARCAGRVWCTEHLTQEASDTFRRVVEA